MTGNTSGTFSRTATSVPSPTLRDRWNAMMDDRRQKRLMDKTGAEFDEAYLSAMIDEHQAAVDLFEDASEDIDGQIQAFAAKHLPSLKAHLEEAKALESKVD